MRFLSYFGAFIAKPSSVDNTTPFRTVEIFLHGVLNAMGILNSDVKH